MVLEMPSFKGVHAGKEVVPTEDNDEVTSSSSSSEVEEGWGGISGSESEETDHLDSAQSRKRRKVSPDPSDDEGKPASVTVTSRLGRKPPKPSAPQQMSARDEEPLEPLKTILAPTDPNTTFESLGVHPWLVQSMSNMAIKRPTGIQKGCIPEILKGRDCIGGSRTGSGKTVAFAIPILQKLVEDRGAIFAVILTPTRELALQIFEQVKSFSTSQTVKAILVTGGADMRPQAIELAKRPHIIIATPGRLADHIRTSGEDTIMGLKRVRFLVLDEADRLLAAHGPGSMLPDVEECLGALPAAAERQTLLFTATVTPEVRALKSMPRGPGRPSVFVCEVDTQALAIPERLAQFHLQVPVTHREHYLHVFLLTAANADRSAIVFCNRATTAEYLHHLLRLLGHRVTALYSRLPQRERVGNLGRFRAAAARVLVATDVAARGLDIPEVRLVVNYDVPRDPDDYIHRVGRTARAGRPGEAVTFVGQRDVDLVLATEARVGRPLLPWAEEGVNLETRVVRDALKLVGEKKREALLELEENRDVGGKRKRGKQKLRAS